jgi:hypothetical protein
MGELIAYGIMIGLVFIAFGGVSDFFRWVGEALYWTTRW